MFINACRHGSAMLSVPQFHDNILVAGFVYGMLRGFRIGWFCIGLENVKFGRACRHFRVSSAIFLGRYGNFCNSISKFGCSAVMNEYISFCILSNGLVMCGFSKWNLCNMCDSVSGVVGLLISLFMKIIVHWMEFSLINWLLCDGVEARCIPLSALGKYTLIMFLSPIRILRSLSTCARERPMLRFFAITTRQFFLQFWLLKAFLWEGLRK